MLFLLSSFRKAVLGQDKIHKKAMQLIARLFCESKPMCEEERFLFNKKNSQCSGTQVFLVWVTIVNGHFNIIIRKNISSQDTAL